MRTTACCTTILSLFSASLFAADPPGDKSSEKEGVTRVACVGDSITFGSGVADREKNSYPAVLDTLLGESYDVRNFGVSGATLQKRGDKPYWTLDEFKDVSAFKPHVVVIKRGT
ncbi:MAG: GDSL-type esterase/lipase family protein, partial [Planctomycetota bacterium]|nr:GDSL-type esterase/lipase family protein [Planctomycetota bacterium]